MENKKEQGRRSTAEGKKKKREIKKESRMKDFLVKEQFKPRSGRSKLRRSIHSVRPSRRKA